MGLGYVSIHAPVMDANNVSCTHGLGDCFNPRARDGREQRGSC